MDTNGDTKTILFKDLSSRLPYGVKVRINTKNNYYTAIVCEITRYYICVEGGGELYFSHGTYKPYLRPMSSMTEEEYEEFCKTDKLMNTLLEINKLGIQGTRECHLMVAKALGERVTEQQNWLNYHHFDYRGLIALGLALEAPAGMYK